MPTPSLNQATQRFETKDKVNVAWHGILFEQHEKPSNIFIFMEVQLKHLTGYMIFFSQNNYVNFKVVLSGIIVWKLAVNFVQHIVQQYVVTIITKILKT
jgi:hypothetical protein